MVTVAIICEYNPFHYGHRYQIESIRKEFGGDAAIVAIMSGNFTQRGEIAVMSKQARAKCAIMGGADLVLELPFPSSSSSAEFFAMAGVSIADSIGNVDYLSFGSESGDISALTEAAEVLSSNEYAEAMAELDKEKSMGYPQKCELAFKRVTGHDNISFTPNNLLAIEYIKALFRLGSKIKPHTIKREGSGYTESEISYEKNQSAMAIRGELYNDPHSAVEHIPEKIRNTVLDAVSDGDAPTDQCRISSAVISYFRLNPPMHSESFHDAGDGLYNRLYNASFKANDISTLLELSETKKFTKARIRRAMWNSFFGVTSSDVKNLPMYTQVLAMNKLGMLVLKNVKCKDGFSILTKPSNFDHFEGIKRRQKDLSDRADSIFELSKPKPKFGNSSLTFTPYIEK